MTVLGGAWPIRRRRAKPMGLRECRVCHNVKPGWLMYHRELCLQCMAAQVVRPIDRRQS